MKSLLFRTRAGISGWGGIAALALLLRTAAPLGAQDDATIAKLRDQKLAEPWLKHASWITDYDKAEGDVIQLNRAGEPVAVTAFTVTDNGVDSFLLDQDGALLFTLQGYTGGLTVVGVDSENTITGTPAADTLVGTPGDDLIQGLGGDDTITGNAGDDTLEGSAGDDRFESALTVFLVPPRPSREHSTRTGGSTGAPRLGGLLVASFLSVASNLSRSLRSLAPPTKPSLRRSLRLVRVLPRRR